MSTQQTLQQIIDLMQSDLSVDAPADSIRWASNLYRTRAVEPKRSFVQKIAAVLQMEIAPNKAAFGERSASASPVRQMLFKAGDNAIDLRIEAKDDAISVRGQILGEGLSGAQVRLFNDTRSYETVASDISEFAIDGIEPGQYELTATGEAIEITLKTLTLE